jgi:hypothetical protein
MWACVGAGSSDYRGVGVGDGEVKKNISKDFVLI